MGTLDWEASSLKRDGIGFFLGSDMHFAHQMSYGWTLFDVSAFTDEAIWDALLNHRDKIDVSFTSIGVGGDLASIKKMTTMGKFFLPLKQFYLGYVQQTIFRTKPVAFSFVDGMCESPEMTLQGGVFAFFLLWFIALVALGFALWLLFGLLFAWLG